MSVMQMDNQLRYTPAANLEPVTMPSVYRRSGSPFYWIKIRDWQGKWIAFSSGMRDKRQAISAAYVLEHQHAQARLGLANPADLMLRQRTNTAIEVCRDMYLSECKSPVHRREREGVIKRFIEHAGIVSAADFAAPGLTGKLYEFMGKAKGKGRTVEWVNKQLWHVQDFAKWLTEHNYARSNEAAKVRALKGRGDRKIRHRGFTPAETVLLAEGECGLFYLSRCWTGLRSSEAVQMVRGDFVLTDKPTMHVRADVAKNKLDCTLPLPLALAAKLTDAIGMLHPTAPAFPGVSLDRNERYKSLAVHLKAAGLDTSELNGRSFRMSHNTWLRLSGLDDTTIGTLRRDLGEGSKLLRRWNYSDAEQLMPFLRSQLAVAESWYAASAKVAAAHGAARFGMVGPGPAR